MRGVVPNADHGGADRLLRAMLQEIEKCKGLVFLATNRPAELDEAMHRRISTVVEYAPPGASESKAIWEGLVAKGKVVTDESVDWDAVALKYELLEDLSRTLYLAAVLFALARSKSTPIVSEQDVRRGCAYNSEAPCTSTTPYSGRKRMRADASFSTLALRPECRREFEHLVVFEQQRGIVYGRWGFADHKAPSPPPSVYCTVRAAPASGRAATRSAVALSTDA